jgi:hypothetical protein
MFLDTALFVCLLNADRILHAQSFFYMDIFFIHIFSKNLKI